MGFTGAVVIGGYINGLGLIRSLAAQRVPTAVIATQPYDIAQHSRHVCASEMAGGGSRNSRSVIDILTRRAGQWGGWALFPSTDDALLAIADHWDQLAADYTIIAPPAEVVRTILDKSAMRRMAEAVGIPQPRRFGNADFTSRSDGIRYPVLIKPIVSHRFFSRFGRKLFVAHGAEELNDCIARVQAAGVGCELVEWIPGGDDQIYAHCVYVDRHGEPRGGVTVHKIRQSPPGFGVARVAEAVKDLPQLREMTLALVKKIGFRGMAAAEFKYDQRDGTFRFIELNGRSVIYNSLLRRAGLDLARLAWADHMEQRCDKGGFNGWSGVWVNLHADLFYSALRRREHRVGWGDFIAPYTRPIIDAAWELADPRPFLVQWSRTAHEGLLGRGLASR